jgi:hypothetical protein
LGPDGVAFGIGGARLAGAERAGQGVMVDGLLLLSRFGWSQRMSRRVMRMEPIARCRATQMRAEDAIWGRGLTTGRPASSRRSRRCSPSFPPAPADGWVPSARHGDGQSGLGMTKARQPPTTLIARLATTLAARTRSRRGSRVKVVSAVRWLHSAVIVSMSAIGSRRDRPSADQVRNEARS